MAVAVQSSASTNWAQTATIVITKPTGLALDDLMVALIFCSTQDIDILSGWTELVDQDAAGGFSSLQYKIADSGDVAASNFTFTPASTAYIAGSILRIDGHAPTALFSDSETEADTNSATQYDWGVTLDPITNGELVIVGGLGEQCTASASVTAPTINGTNPTWTEVLDNSVDEGGLNYLNAYVAYAIQATATQITSFTATLTNTDASTDGYGIIATLSPQINVTGTHAHLSVSPTLVAPVATSGVTGTHAHLSISPTLNAPVAKGEAPTAKNITKNTGANVTNIPKS
jgi:hypothetical protein